MHNYSKDHRATGIGHTLIKLYETFLIGYEHANREDISTDTCGYCRQAGPHSDWLNCDGCKRWFHYQCEPRGNLPPFKKFEVQDGLIYFCQECDPLGLQLPGLDEPRRKPRDRDRQRSDGIANTRSKRPRSKRKRDDFIDDSDLDSELEMEIEDGYLDDDKLVDFLPSDETGGVLIARDGERQRMSLRERSQTQRKLWLDLEVDDEDEEMGHGEDGPSPHHNAPRIEPLQALPEGVLSLDLTNGLEKRFPVRVVNTVDEAFPRFEYLKQSLRVSCAQQP
eukprot:scaffold747_cov308-Prasinococcus_capsulatus_cf.AAC.1